MNMAIESQEQKKPRVPVAFDESGVRIANMDDAYRFAEMVIQSGCAPKGVTRPQQVMISIQAGAELGLTPLRSLSCIPVINGRASIMGDAALALVRDSGLMTGDLAREYSGEGDAYGCTVTSHRRGSKDPVSHSFTVADATKARLWGKAGPWTEYPDRMLYYRALGFHLRDQYSDVLMGLAISEEVRDYPAKRPETPELVVTSDPDPLLAQITNGTHDAELEVETAEDNIDPETGEEIPDFILDGGPA